LLLLTAIVIINCFPIIFEESKYYYGEINMNLPKSVM